MRGAPVIAGFVRGSSLSLTVPFFPLYGAVVTLCCSLTTARKSCCSAAAARLVAGLRAGHAAGSACVCLRLC